MPKKLTRARPVEPIGQPTADWTRSTVDRADFVSERLPYLKVLYDTEQKPVYVWRAYEVAREAGVDIPTWVLEYFDLAAQNLTWLGGALLKMKAQKKKISGLIAPGVVAALGFVPGGVKQTFIANHWPDESEASREKPGRFNPFAYIAMGPPELWYTHAVHHYHVHAGNKLSVAKRAAAKLHHVSVRTVERALEKYPLEMIDERGRLIDRDIK